MEDMIRIAIDGPAGAGKSTIAKNVAKRLNILHLDTGAMYRAVGLYAVENNIDPQDEEKVSDMLCNVDIKVRYKNGAQQTFLNGEDVSGKIRTSEISNAASAVSKWPEVRKLLVSIQKNIASKMSIVMDGRDIGTFVMPDAEYKFFLTASVDQRAKRRYLELAGKGMQAELNAVKSDIAQRDHQDTTRQFAPLKKADDAMEIDTTELDISQVLQKVYERLGI